MREDFGASILPWHAVQREAAERKLRISHLAEPGLWRGAHLMYPAGRSVSRAQEAVRDLLRETIDHLRRSGRWAAARVPARHREVS